MKRVLVTAACIIYMLSFLIIMANEAQANGQAFACCDADAGEDCSGACCEGGFGNDCWVQNCYMCACQGDIEEDCF